MKIVEIYSRKIFSNRCGKTRETKPVAVGLSIWIKVNAPLIWIVTGWTQFVSFRSNFQWIFFSFFFVKTNSYSHLLAISIPIQITSTVALFQFEVKVIESVFGHANGKISKWQDELGSLLKTKNSRSFICFFLFDSRTRFREVADIARTCQLLFEVNSIRNSSFFQQKFFRLESWRSRVKTWAFIENSFSSVESRRILGFSQKLSSYISILCVCFCFFLNSNQELFF